MSGFDFRPITDFWILARPKVKYYGAYPSGFLERARNLLGVSITDTVLHVCSGCVRQYPFRGLGLNDLTLDADPFQLPDFLLDAQEGPYVEQANRKGVSLYPANASFRSSSITLESTKAALCDPPYSPEEALHYTHQHYPVPAKILGAAGLSVPVGGRVGFLHRKIPRPPKWMRPVAYVAVMVGYENDLRCYSVFERMT